MMLGYAEGPGDLARGREVHRLRTGDLARRGDDGLWEVVGRLSRTAKVMGLRIDLDRVERALVADGVRALVASTPPVDGATEQLVVAVEPRATGGATRLLARVRRLVAAATGLPAAAVQVHAVARLPRLATGKPDHRAVAALARPAPERSGPAQSGSAQPETVRDVLTAVLGRSVGDDDTPAGLGGDSLTYVETSVRLEEALGHLPPDWHLRTVAELEGTAVARTRRGRAVETNVVLRAVAIVAVVGTHANLLTLLGGAHLLLALAGFNLARFALGDVTRRERVRRLLTGAARVVVPAVLWIGGTALLLGAYPWQTALLVNGFLGPPGWTEPAWHHWFVEALVLLVLGVGRAGRRAGARPHRAALAVLVPRRPDPAGAADPLRAGAAARRRRHPPRPGRGVAADPGLGGRPRPHHRPPAGRLGAGRAHGAGLLRRRRPQRRRGRRPAGADLVAPGPAAGRRGPPGRLPGRRLPLHLPDPLAGLPAPRGRLPRPGHPAQPRGRRARLAGRHPRRTRAPPRPPTRRRLPPTRRRSPADPA